MYCLRSASLSYNASAVAMISVVRGMFGVPFSNHNVSPGCNIPKKPDSGPVGVSYNVKALSATPFILPPEGWGLTLPSRARTASATKDAWSPINSALFRRHQERVLLGWPRDQIYSTVANVHLYSQFLPWVVKSIVDSCDGVSVEASSRMHATMEVGFSPPDGVFKVLLGGAALSEKYTSDVLMDPSCNEYIISTLAGDSGKAKSVTMERLYSEWTFAERTVAGEEGNLTSVTEVSYSLLVEFRSQLVAAALSETVLGYVGRDMLRSFETRCENIYGKPVIAKRHL